jgi:alkylation response protein AidB-like acyl-CoA dehydrogenase
MVDHGQKNTTFASMAKLFASEHCHKCVHDAIQIYGGAGFNEDFPVAKLARVSAASPSHALEFPAHDATSPPPPPPPPVARTPAST